MLVININDHRLDVSPEKAFNALFSDAPNSMCILKDEEIINFNNIFVERCGFDIANELLDKFTISKKIFNKTTQESLLIFDGYTKGLKHIGGEILVSQAIEENYYFGFIQVMWIEGLEEFEQVIDQMNRLITTFLNESNVA